MGGSSRSRNLSKSSKTSVYGVHRAIHSSTKRSQWKKCLHPHGAIKGPTAVWQYGKPPLGVVIHHSTTIHNWSPKESNPDHKSKLESLTTILEWWSGNTWILWYYLATGPETWEFDWTLTQSYPFRSSEMRHLRFVRAEAERRSQGVFEKNVVVKKPTRSTSLKTQTTHHSNDPSTKPRSDYSQLSRLEKNNPKKNVATDTWINCVEEDKANIYRERREKCKFFPNKCMYCHQFFT